MMYLASHAQNHSPVGVVITRNQDGIQQAGVTPLIGREQPSQYNSQQKKMASSLIYPDTDQSAATAKVSVDEVLFDAKAAAKILTSRVSMYLRDGWREKLFYQLDLLLDPQEWDPQDTPLQPQSFDTFLKAICDVNPTKRPGIGISNAGNLVAGWRNSENGEDRVSLEFEPGQRVLLIGSRIIDGQTESFSARTAVRNLKKTLSNLNCSQWLGCDYPQET